MICQVGMTIEELAAYLRLPASRLLALARAGGLPGEQVGKQWRFHRDDIDRWLETAAEDLHSLAQVEGSETEVGCTESSDIEEYEAFMAPWDLELKQLSGGRFHTRVQYTKLPGILVYEANWLRAARTHGAAPEGLVMIGTNLAWRRGRNFWCVRGGAPHNHRGDGCRKAGEEGRAADAGRRHGRHGLLGHAIPKTSRALI